jgi:RNA polymerase sigma-70 factor (ECF subfamily)
VLSFLKRAPAPPTPTAEEDEQDALVSGALSGDPEAVQMLLAAVGGPMLQVVRKVLGPSHSDSEDVLQDAMMGLLDGLPGFRGECTLLHFACRVALFSAMATRRRQTTRLRTTDDQVALEEIGDGTALSPLGRTIEQRRAEALRRVLDELPPKIGQALACHFMLGQTTNEMARSLKVPVNTVWSRLRLGKEALRQRVVGDPQLAELFEVEP